MNYYYLIASLPSLSMDEPPALSAEAFLALCAEHLSGTDLAEVSAIMADPLSAAGGFAADWQAWDIQLRNIAAEIRAEREKRDASPFTRPESSFDATLDQEVVTAFAHHSPLDRDRALDRLRWKKAEEMAGFNPFSPKALKSYALRLVLAGRWAALDTDAGTARVELLVSRPERGTAVAATELAPAMT